MDNNRFRLIGYCGNERDSQFEGISTLKEKSVANYYYSAWPTFFKKDVPVEIIQALRSGAKSIAEENDFHQQLIK